MCLLTKVFSKNRVISFHTGCWQSLDNISNESDLKLQAPKPNLKNDRGAFDFYICDTWCLIARSATP